MKTEAQKEANRIRARKWKERHPGHAKDYYRSNAAEIARKTRAAKDADPEVFRLRNRRYWSSSKGRAGYLLRSAKQRCDNVTVSKEWIQQRLDAGRCEVTGLPFQVVGMGDNIKNPWSPSLDRRVPGMGYTPENTRLVVWVYNVAKGSWKHGDVLVMAKALLEAKEQEKAA